MGIEKVVFYSTSDREDQKGVVKKISLTGQNLGFILKREMTWGDFYSYIMSVGHIEDLSEVPE